MFDLPGGSSPTRIRTDPAHTYHIGYGKDENASILMMLVKVGHFGARGSVDKKLEDAFERFATFCKNSRKHTSIIEFSKKQFKINKGLPVSKGSLRHTRLFLIFIISYLSYILIF